MISKLSKCLLVQRDRTLAAVNPYWKKISSSLLTLQMCRGIFMAVASAKATAQHCCVTSLVCQHHLIGLSASGACNLLFLRLLITCSASEWR